MRRVAGAVLMATVLALSACGGGGGPSAATRDRLLARGDAIARSEGRIPNADTRQALLELAKELCRDNNLALSAYIHLRSTVNARSYALEDAIFDVWCPEHRSRWSDAKARR